MNEAMDWGVGGEGLEAKAEFLVVILLMFAEKPASTVHPLKSILKC